MKISKLKKYAVKRLRPYPTSIMKMIIHYGSAQAVQYIRFTACRT